MSVTPSSALMWKLPSSRRKQQPGICSQGSLANCASV